MPVPYRTEPSQVRKKELMHCDAGTHFEHKEREPQPAAIHPHCFQISVCMAAYNGERFIRHQIASILPQLSAEDELVIVDDGSADRSVAIIEAFGDSRVKLLRNQHNGGVLRAYERALGSARGDLVFLSDQDDIWRPEKVAVCCAYFDAHPDVSLVVSDADVIDDAGKVVAGTWMTHGGFRDGIMANLIRNHYMGCVMAFRRNLLTRCLPFPPDLPMHDMWVGMVNQLEGKAALIPQVLMSYRRHGGNVTTGRHASWPRMLWWRLSVSRNLMARFVRLRSQKQIVGAMPAAEDLAGDGQPNLFGHAHIIPNAAMGTEEEKSAFGKRSAPKRGIVLAPFFSLDGSANRPRLAGSVLAEFMPVDVVTSDFDHSLKSKREQRGCEPFAQVIYLEAPPYHGNVSVARVISHLRFAFKAAAYFRRTRHLYDVVYASVPLNSLTWLVFNLAGARIKIIDVVDIWPDVLPFSPLAKRASRPVFAIWKWFFKSAVVKADVVMGVSDTFIAEASRYAKSGANIKRFYLGHGRLNSAVPKQTVFTIAYIGNIGRLCDFETLLDVLSEAELRDHVQLFVIGAGDRQEWLLSELGRRQIQHQFFGVVFDAGQVADILGSCHVGFNGYINTSASFSYKAATYLAAGLPLINSMTGDLHRLVAEHGLGENYEGGDRQQLRDCFLRLCGTDRTAMASNCERFFAAEIETAKVAADLREFLLGNLGGPFDAGSRERSGAQGVRRYEEFSAGGAATNQYHV